MIFEAVVSGISKLPLSAFLSVMLPIHLAINLVDGLITIAVVTFIWRARPEILELTAGAKPLGYLHFGKIVTEIALAAMVISGNLSRVHIVLSGRTRRVDGPTTAIFQR